MRFSREQIERDVLSLRSQGFIGVYSSAEIEAACAKMDRELSADRKSNPANVRAARRGAATRVRANDAKRKATLERVHALMEKQGLSALAACKRIDVKYVTYMLWRKRYGILPDSKKGARCA